MFAIGKTAENLKIEKLTLFSILPQYRDSHRRLTNFQGCIATYIITFVNVGTEVMVSGVLRVPAWCFLNQQALLKCQQIAINQSFNLGIYTEYLQRVHSEQCAGIYFGKLIV